MDRSPLAGWAIALMRSLRDKGVRDRTGLHAIEGVRAVLQDTIIHSRILLRNGRAQRLVRLAGCRTVDATPEEFRRVSIAERASGIAAIVRQHWRPLEGADPRRGLCWIAVRWLRSPGNLGTILRAAEAAGAAGLICLGRAMDPFDPNVVRASMGSLFHLQFVRAELPAFAAWARRHGCRVIGTSPSAAAAYTEVPVEPPVVVMLGEERGGLTADEKAACTHMARIPIAGRADSLNVAVAAGVMLYEILRRRP